jgi:hypothetical protein
MSLSFITLGTYIEEHLTKSLSPVIITCVLLLPLGIWTLYFGVRFFPIAWASGRP